MVGLLWVTTVSVIVPVRHLAIISLRGTDIFQLIVLAIIYYYFFFNFSPTSTKPQA